MAITQLTDVRDFTKRDIPDSDNTWVESKIDEAEALLRPYVGGSLTTWVAAKPETRTDDVVLVVCRMVDRVLKNPDGYSAEADGDYSYARDRGLSSGEIYASKADLRILGVGTRRRFGSIRLHLPPESPRNASRGC